MKYQKYILVISIILIASALPAAACGPYFPDDPKEIRFFRVCSPELELQWQNGCRFQDYEMEKNCISWQEITSPSIPLHDIKEVIYNASLSDIRDFPEGDLSANKFAAWLSSGGHDEDLKYVIIAKEIEEIRKYLNNPWYYAYEGDEEHILLKELKDICKAYTGKRHAARYALQIIRLNFATGDFKSCIDLWENNIRKLPVNIVTDMVASYVGGAYTRLGNRDKAIALFTRSQDIGSLITLKAWKGMEKESAYSDERIKELEYIFNRFPNSPLLNIKLQEYVREWERNKDDYEKSFFNELKLFARNAIASPKCNQKGMWRYTLGYLHYLDNDMARAMTELKKAEKSELSPYLKESVRAFRFLMDAVYADNFSKYNKKFLDDLNWLDGCLERDASELQGDGWQYSNKMNYPFYYWQDVARKVLLGVLYPIMMARGQHVLALQLANYASNRMHQLHPVFNAYYQGYDEKGNWESYTEKIPFEDYRNTWKGINWYDYSNQFFKSIDSAPACKAEEYARRIVSPVNETDRFLNERGYTDSDYIFDIVGTLYLREMNYAKAVEWLSKVSPEYQSRTNIAKEGYFKLDPFQYQTDKKVYIKDPGNYKLKYAQEMLRLEKEIDSDINVNLKANAKIRFAIGLRNSFGRCWYLTYYGYGYYHYCQHDCVQSDSREGFKGIAPAQKAYKRVDELMSQALSEFTDPRQAAKALYEMKNYATLVKEYPGSKEAAYIRSRCDNYHDYALHKR